MYGMTLPELMKNWFVGLYYDKYACRRGKHWMKMSGCVYCGKL